MAYQINYMALYAVVGFGIFIAPTIAILVRDLYIDITKSVECIFVDTGRMKLVRGYRNKHIFTDKKSKRSYVADEKRIKNKRVFYVSECSEPIGFTIDTVDTSKTMYFVDSNEYSIKFNAAVFEKFAASKEVGLIKFILYGVIGCIILCFLIAYKTGALSFGGGS